MLFLLSPINIESKCANPTNMNFLIVIIKINLHLHYIKKLVFIESNKIYFETTLVHIISRDNIKLATLLLLKTKEIFVF